MCQGYVLSHSQVPDWRHAYWGLQTVLICLSNDERFLLKSTGQVLPKCVLVLPVCGWSYSHWVRWPVTVVTYLALFSAELEVQRSALEQGSVSESCTGSHLVNSIQSTTHLSSLMNPPRTPPAPSHDLAAQTKLPAARVKAIRVDIALSPSLSSIWVTSL